MTQAGVGTAMRGQGSNSCTQPHIQRDWDELGIICRENGGKLSLGRKEDDDVFLKLDLGSREAAYFK